MERQREQQQQQQQLEQQQQRQLELEEQQRQQREQQQQQLAKHHVTTLGRTLKRAREVEKHLEEHAGALQKREGAMREQLQRGGELVERLQQATERASTLQQQLGQGTEAGNGWITVKGKRGAAQRKTAAAAAARPRGDAAGRERESCNNDCWAARLVSQLHPAGHL
jgi:DNA repair exonuclease SbcCD ATPase subunit